MDVNFATRDLPREMNAKEPFYHTHKINFDEVGEDTLELLFHCIIRGEENKIVNVQPKGKGDSGWSVGRIIRIDYVARVKARIILLPLDTHGKENGVDLVVPVFRASAETIECFL